jgi:hypothetical protein
VSQKRHHDPQRTYAIAGNAFCAHAVVHRGRALDSAAFCAAGVSSSDQRRNGTQDVNDPVYGLTTRPEGRSGSFTSWDPRAAFDRQTAAALH